MLENVQRRFDRIEADAPLLTKETNRREPQEDQTTRNVGTRTSRKTKKKDKNAYLRTCVREPQKRGISVLDNEIGRRIPQIIL